ncbi:MAG: S-layer homology domain-containing protein [Lachnospiraceae bacterium]|nr:S-layer homology domain-containing protein [Lachnospiraceae bacterium]
MVDGKYFAASTSDRTTSIQVSAYKKFRLENAKGEYLAYDGENYSGNMKIYDCYTYGLDDSLMWNITVAESTEFKLTKAEDGCQLIATIGGQGYAVTANGADKVSISSAGISASGKDYTLDAFVQSKNNDIIRLQAEADGKTTIKKNSGKIVVNSDSYCKDTTVCRFSEGEKEEIGPSKVSDKKTEIETGDEIILPFTDVKKGRWFYEYVEYVYKKGIMTGLNATTFGPEDNITRAMVVTVLWRMAGEPEPASKGKVFPDVPTGKWYSKAVAWAKENKIVGGYSTGLFGTDDNIIRQDFVKILKGYTNYIGAEIPADTFESYIVKDDAKDVSGYAREYVQWAFQRSIIGQGSGLNPKGFLTRAET